MPIVNVKLLDTGVTNEQKAELIKRTTQVLVDVLSKKPETTHVVIEEVATTNWGVAGKALSEQQPT